MLPSDRRSVCGVATALAVPGLALCLLLRAPQLLPAFRDQFFLQATMPEESTCSNEIERAFDDVKRRSAAKCAIGVELLCGRTTLLEAAAQMRHLDRGCADFRWERFREAFAGDSDEERHCREAICYLRGSMPYGDPAAESAAHRLEEELRQRLAQGTLCLPASTMEP